MKAIVINGRFFSQTVTGVQRYGLEVLRSLDAQLSNGEIELPDSPVEVLVPPGTQAALELQTIRVRSVGWGSGHFWEQLALPLYCQGKLLFTPSGGSPLLHRNHVFTIPDAAVFATPQAYSSRYAAWYQWHHRRAVGNSHMKLLTVSEFSKSELSRWLGISSDRVVVTSLGHEHALRVPGIPAVLERLELKRHGYVLGVGSANPNKNFAGLLAAFARVRLESSLAACRLVLVGGANARIFGEEATDNGGIIRPGYLSDGELRSLYENAACFVFPSLYEGFGLPPLEAMALGCPVVCARAASLPEVCGDAALWFNPRGVDEMALSMRRMLEDAELRMEYSKRGYQQSVQFRWDETARLTWDVLMNAARR